MEVLLGTPMNYRACDIIVLNIACIGSANFRFPFLPSPENPTEMGIWHGIVWLQEWKLLHRIGRYEKEFVQTSSAHMVAIHERGVGPPVSHYRRLQRTCPPHPVVSVVVARQNAISAQRRAVCCSSGEEMKLAASALGATYIHSYPAITSALWCRRQAPGQSAARREESCSSSSSDRVGGWVASEQD